jgi:hypothetical protein
MNYRFDDFNWLATMDGFNVPTDVYNGTVYLGTIESKPEGYTIRLVDTPKGKQPIQQSANNSFKSKQQAAQVLHRTWQTIRSED